MDAIFAVVLMDSSMQTCAIFNMDSSLHAPFPYEPETHYESMANQILSCLNLLHLIEPQNEMHPNESTNEFEELDQGSFL
jgi:hypothetical protein